MFPKGWWNSPPCPTLGPCPCPLVPHPGTPTATKLPSPPPERSPRGAAWPRMQGVARTQGRGTLRAAPSSASYPPYGKAGIWTTDTSSLYDLRSDYVRKNIVFLKIMIKYTFFLKVWNLSGTRERRVVLIERFWKDPVQPAWENFFLVMETSDHSFCFKWNMLHLNWLWKGKIVSMDTERQKKNVPSLHTLTAPVTVLLFWVSFSAF